jgi:signal transduction histidine kinase
MQRSISTSPPLGGTLAEPELVSSLSWLIALRWLAGAGVLLGTCLSSFVLDLPLPSIPLYLLGLGILAYNALFWWVLSWLNASPPRSSSVYQWFARIQIGLDWIAMAVLIQCTGGIESPAILFLLLHIIISSLLLPHDRGFLYVTLAPAVVGGIAFLEYRGVLPHVRVFEPARYDHVLYIVAVLFFFTMTCYTMAYLLMTISRRLRRREDELAALYRSVQATTSLDLPEVLNRLAEVTTMALRCKAAAIRLLDKTGSYLEIAGAYGLSEAYRDKGPIEVACARIDQEALSGKPVLVANASQDDRLCYPERVASEGIHTILSTPLIGKTGPIGVLRAYGGTGHHFTADDMAFLSAISAQGAVAIENARAYRLLQDLDKSKSQFVRIVTHELRSPVQVAFSLLNVLERGSAGALNEKQADLIARGRRRMEFLQTLIDDLLDLAAGKTTVLDTAERGPVSLTDVCKAVRARFETQAQAKGLSLRLEHPGKEELTVWGDKGELDRMLNNLVSNAIKYTPAGEVRLSLERADGSAHLLVSDTGIGIPQDAFPHLFQEFFRAKNARDLEEAGTGLGLCIVKDLVQRYGGKIAVESVEGRGTTFALTLPLAQ